MAANGVKLPEELRGLTGPGCRLRRKKSDGITYNVHQRTCRHALALRRVIVLYCR